VVENFTSRHAETKRNVTTVMLPTKRVRFLRVFVDQFRVRFFVQERVDLAFKFLDAAIGRSSWMKALQR